MLLDLPQVGIWFTEARYLKIKNLGGDEKLSSGMALVFQVADGVDKNLFDRVRKERPGMPIAEFIRRACENELRKKTSKITLSQGGVPLPIEDNDQS